MEIIHKNIEQNEKSHFSGIAFDYTYMKNVLPIISLIHLINIFSARENT